MTLLLALDLAEGGVLTVVVGALVYLVRSVVVMQMNGNAETAKRLETVASTLERTAQTLERVSVRMEETSHGSGV